MPKVKSVHPNSRKALQLSRQVSHDVCVARRQKERRQKTQSVSERAAWFQRNVDEGVAAYSVEEARALIERYLHRFDDELRAAETAAALPHRRPNHSARIVHINFTLDQERNEFASVGLHIPDILAKRSLDFLKAWDGSPNTLANVKLRRIKATD